MSVTRHPLAERHPGLVDRDKDLSAELNPFYNEALTALTTFEAAIAKAGEISDDLKDEVRRQRQQEIVAQAFTDLQTAVDAASQPYKAAAGTIRQEIEAASRPAAEKTEISELIALMKSQEIRRDLMGLPLEERSRILRASVTAGNRDVLTAVEGGLVPLLPAAIVENAREAYIENALPDRLRALELAENLAGSVGTTQRFLEPAARGIAEKSGLGDIFQRRREPQRQAALTMTDAEKVGFIAEHGLEALKALLS